MSCDLEEDPNPGSTYYSLKGVLRSRTVWSYSKYIIMNNSRREQGVLQKSQVKIEKSNLS